MHLLVFVARICVIFNLITKSLTLRFEEIRVQLSSVKNEVLTPSTADRTTSRLSLNGNSRISFPLSLYGISTLLFTRRLAGPQRDSTTTTGLRPLNTGRRGLRQRPRPRSSTRASPGFRDRPRTPLLTGTRSSARSRPSPPRLAQPSPDSRQRDETRHNAQDWPCPRPQLATDAPARPQHATPPRQASPQSRRHWRLQARPAPRCP